MKPLSERATIERIRAIEGELALLRVDAYTRAGLPMPERWERIRAIVDVAAHIFRMTPPQIIGPCRSRAHCRARFAVMWLADRCFGMSSVEIGRSLGGRDHTTVLSGLRRASEWREQDESYAHALDRLVELFVPQGDREEAANAQS